MARRTLNEIIVADETALTIMDYQPVDNPALANSLVSLESQIRAAAYDNLQQQVGTDLDTYTETERDAMMTVESLRLTNGLDLAVVLLRARYLRDIQTRNLLAAHPGGYQTLAEMAQDQGISASELSQTMDLTNIIFPFVQNRLGIPIADLWSSVGKSKLRELAPILKRIITGEPSDTRTTEDGANASVEETVRTLLESADGVRYQILQQLEQAETEAQRQQILALADMDGEEVDELRQEFNERVQRDTVDRLINHGMTMNVRQLREAIRPTHTDTIPTSIVPLSGNRRLVTMIVDNDQMAVLERRLGAAIEAMTVNLPEDARQRQATLARVREIREIMRLMGA